MSELGLTKGFRVTLLQISSIVAELAVSYVTIALTYLAAVYAICSRY